MLRSKKVISSKLLVQKSTGLKKGSGVLGKNGQLFQNCFWILKLVLYPHQFKNSSTHKAKKLQPCFSIWHDI